MLIEIDIHAVDLPDPDLVYANYLETRRRAGVTGSGVRLDSGMDRDNRGLPVGATDHASARHRDILAEAKRTNVHLANVEGYVRYMAEVTKEPTEKKR